ncbi:DUF4097 family beta strand repeat-containing protein [Streptomyces hoynatensis]|uniref:DUF4097 domain-containing protein n=1 Tax=Streptomyces hoynatensis TaxID=1141874 RepID=A0A3A9ZCI9_9ACTN|nr:DUF4097 family beta strand repeat-containing protein [Streptomyces hoynatensis]RKN45574.1 hypothetical protein D7294_03590 [Streptomyces hoynatensis]
MQKFDTPAPISAVLDIPAGRIRFLAADRADTTVEVLPLNAARGRDVKAAERTTVAYSDGVLRIEAPAGRNQYLGPSGSVEVTIQLPAGSGVEATSSCAGFRAVGRLGEVVFEGADGEVRIDEAASLRLTAFGEVSVGRLGGPARISTQKGDIRIGEAAGGTVVLTTQLGDVSIAAAPGVSASLDAGTTYGRVHNTLRNADGAAAALTIRATTSHGDITARSL